LMNLCVNARDAMPNGGILQILAEPFVVDEHYSKMNLDAQVGTYIAVTIEDTGIGMTADVIERIFEPFFTTKEVGKGTGLGLATTLGIVKSHGGFITVNSQLGKGSQFRVFLPTVDGIVAASPIASAPPLGQGELILIVDDETTIQEITALSLENYGYRVLTASNGIEAIATYVQHQPEVAAILIDIIMPSMDGLTAIRTLNIINPQVKIIATSGRTASDRVMETEGLNIKTFLSKPYTMTELLENLYTVLH
jgi:two-component system, cell cycle sensor histidine kinase and response regulator CckA